MSLPALHSPSASDAALFQRYQAAPDGESFRQLVDRHLPLVWSTARRLANGDAALAEDIAQIVFTDFARKAPALPPDTLAAGWLHRHTCFTARKMVRTEIRRRTREHTAAQIQLHDTMHPEPDALWLEAAPHLDTAIDQLSRADREALLLRFWQQQDHRSIGAALGTSEDTARKRIARALEKLRALLRRRGVLLTVAFLGQCLTDHATAAVPSALAATLPGAAWRQATATGPITAVPSSHLRRFWPAAATALLVSAALWTVLKTDVFHQTPSTPQLASSLASTPPIDPNSTSREITLHFTLVDLPAKHLSARLLTYQPGEDDEALFNEVKQLATAAGRLLEFDITAASGQSRQFAKTIQYPYVERWAWNPKTQQPDPKTKEVRRHGTICEAIPTRLATGAIQLKWALDYNYAEPEFHAWPISLRTSGEPSNRIVKVEDFHHSQSTGFMGELTEAVPRLLLAQQIDSAALPDTLPQPRTLLLFVTLTPP
jgi:RNA polymerase sigma factor (sigma-70 family)